MQTVSCPIGRSSCANRALALSLATALAAAAAPPSDSLFMATPLTEDGAFTEGIEGPACDRQGNIYAVNYARQQTIGKVTPTGQGTVWAELPGKSTGNGIRFDANGVMFVADYVGHNILRIDPSTRAITIHAHHVFQPVEQASSPRIVGERELSKRAEDASHLSRLLPESRP